MPPRGYTSRVASVRVRYRSAEREESVKLAERLTALGFSVDVFPDRTSVGRGGAIIVLAYGDDIELPGPEIISDLPGIELVED